MPEIIEKLSRHPQARPLSAYVRTVALTTARARSGNLVHHAAERPFETPLTREQAETEYGNIFDLVERDDTTAEQRNVVAALLALSTTNDFPSSPESEGALTADLLWLAAHTPLNALLAVDAVLGERALSFWQALAKLAENPGLIPGFGNSEALCAAAALRAAGSPAARSAAAAVAARVRDPLARALLGAEALSGHASLDGELTLPPRGPLLTATLAVTLILPLIHLIRLVAKLALSYKHPASVKLGPQGLELSHHTELLGRVLKQRATLVPLSNLARVTREVRFPRLGMYAGLIALVLGSYFGVGLFVDGVTVPGASFPLLGLSVVFILGGLLIDLALTVMTDALRGRCRLVVEPKKGRRLCVGGIDPKLADAMLATLAHATLAHATLA